MTSPSRRDFAAAALAIGAFGVMAGRAQASRTAWREDRTRFPEGVASGDPDAQSVILWTRCPQIGQAQSASLTVEIAEDALFQRVVAAKPVSVQARTDWTCRVLIGGLKPGHEYWYRFTAADGAGSRVGRTLTAPRTDDPNPVAFAFVSCQNVNQGAQNAYRRMIFEDQGAAPADRLGFVLHLGDFIYEIVWKPQERPQGMYDRRIRDILTYPVGEKIADFHVPVTVDDYRTVYRAYLQDPDLQDARARWPFVAMWDNHEFSWLGWQGMQQFDGVARPAQTRKVAANQAWFEYLPTRSKTTDGSLSAFAAPVVADHAIEHFDEHGLGLEANNLTAIRSLTGYRALRWGANVKLILTDQRSYRSQDPTNPPAAKKLSSKLFPDLVPEETLQMIDAGRTWQGGQPPATVETGAGAIDNHWKDWPAQTMLGAEQKAWFFNELASSKATWTIWGDTVATIPARADPQNLPAGLTTPWTGAGYAGVADGDHSNCYLERREIYDFVAHHKVPGFVTIAGDRHSFWAGLAAADLPPKTFDPVGVAFVVGSISAPGMVEAIEHSIPKSHPLRPLYLIDRKDAARPEPAVNLLFKHGVATCLDYAAHGDLVAAKAKSNPENAPHVSFVDMGGHGYSVVRASQARIEVEFVCIPRPIERATTEDGGPLRYRVVHTAARWTPGERPKLLQSRLEGDASLSF